MRKWTYLVAALMLGGATATFTGCIDTEEPAGIEELRGAKAALINAKADYQRALLAYREMQTQILEVDLQLKQVVLQIEQLKVAKAEAQNRYDIAEIENDILELAEKHEAEMARLKAETATQQQALNQALIDLEKSLATYRDDVYVNDILNAISALDGYRTTLASAEDNVISIQRQLLNAEAQLGDNYRLGLVRDSLRLENAKKVQDELLETVGALTDLSASDLNAKIVDINKDIAKVDADVLDLTTQIKEIEALINPIDDAIAEIENKFYQPDQTVTIPMAKVAAEIQEDFIGIMQTTTVNWATVQSAPFFNEEETQMTADYVSQKTGLKKIFASSNSSDRLDEAVEELAEEVYTSFSNRFATRYNLAFGQTLPLDAGRYIISNEHIKLAQTKVDELKQDAETAYDIFKADSLAWENALKAYQAAAKAYGFTYTLYSATGEALTTYWNESDPTKKAAALTAARTALVSYYAVRVPLDNPALPQVTPTGATAAVALNVALGNSTTFTDAMLGTCLDGYSNIGDILGVEIDLNDKTYTPTLDSDASKDGALQAYIRAAKKVWNSGISSVGEARVTPATDEEYDYMLDNSTSWDGSWFVYMNTAEGYQIFNNIEDWFVLYNYLVEQTELYAAAIDAIDLEIAAKNVEKKDEEDKKFKLEFERNSLDNTQSWTSGNPYQATLVGKKQSLEDLRSSIEGVISGYSSQYTVYIYEVSVNTASGEFYSANWVQKTGSIQSIINDIEDNNLNVVEALDMAKANIEAFDKGWVESLNGTIESLNRQLKDAEATRDNAKKMFDLYSAQLNNLLDAYANGNETPAE